MAFVSTGLGAVIALSGSLLTSIRSGHNDLGRQREAHRRQAYLDFVSALNAAHAALRNAIDTPAASGDRRSSAREAVNASGLYGAREQFLMFSSATVATAGEAAFGAVIQVQGVAGTPAGLDSPEYHAVYHDLANRLWNLRMAVRADVGERSLAPADFGHSDWSERQECEVCQSRNGPPPGTLAPEGI